ncbi:MAG TPA: hypothetical protein DD490_33090, partial [Acidobacteria bacterium]|nr:hypothetical protein [Acidobacteriota bacterium]
LLPAAATVEPAAARRPAPPPGIAPQEGAEAFVRILGRGPGTRVVVSPRDPGAIRPPAEAEGAA